MEDGSGECAVRRSQGGSNLRPEADVEERTGAANAEIRKRDSAGDRAGQGYSGTGRVHGRPDDGVDHGYVFHDGGAYRPGCGDREANFDWWICWTGGSYRPGFGVRGGRGLQDEEDFAAWRDRGD